MSKQKASELGNGHAEPLSSEPSEAMFMLKLNTSELGKGHAVQSYVSYPLVVAMCAAEMAGSPCSLRPAKLM